MAEVRYVVVSDLHFGAENSMLTSLVESPTAVTAGGIAGFAADTGTPSPVLRGFLDAVRHLTEGQAAPPQLVLAGDALDLALSPDEAASTVFAGFMRLAFGEGRPLFDRVVCYLPGNHDHHLWETARERQYVAHFAELRPGEPIAPAWHTTRSRLEAQSPPAVSDWLTALAHCQPGGGDVEVRVAYPNLTLLAPSGRAVVVSHGHFTEPIYTLMSRLKAVLYPAQQAGAVDDIDRWEEENFAWIDFLWSTLGQSGQVGTDLGLVYAGLSSPRALDALVANVARAALGRGKGPAFLHPAERWLITAIFRAEANHLVRSERATPDVVLGPAGQAGVRRYLEGPVARQLREELGAVPEDLTFVFGHTHKPFVDTWSLAGLPAPVQVVNTGGWVVDQAHPSPTHAATAVLLDENLDVASVQVYRQGTGTPAPVQVLPGPPGDTRGDAFRAQLAARIDPAAGPWAALTADAARLEEQRHRLQAAALAGPRPA